MTTLINLLPDLRQAKLKERRRRQLATGVGVTVWVVCGAVIALLSVYAAGQKVVISNHTKSIAEKEDSLRSVTGLVDALTANQHLASLPDLYGQRVYLSKFFEAYSQSDPTSVALSSLQVDSSNLLTILGTAPSYAEVAKLARALTAANVTVGPGASESNTPYFTSVTIGGLDYSDKAGVSFTITANLQSEVTSGSSN